MKQLLKPGGPETKSKLEIENTKFKVAVLAGGIGSERQVSLQSGQCVAKALSDAGMEVVLADIEPENMGLLEDSSIDVFFLALHGKFGEDGQLQQILEEKNLTYTASGPAASKLAFDKMAAKTLFTKADIQTPDAIEVTIATDFEQLQQELTDLAERYVVKPIRQGSSIGISIVSTPAKAVAAARKNLAEFGDCMIERFVPGREITVCILNGTALPIIEVKTQSGFYDYHAKYIDEKTEYLCETIAGAALVEQISAAAVACFNALRCRHFARVDFILAGDNTPYALEINTIPGFTTHSLLPRAAAKAGIPMSRLCAKIVDSALQTRKLQTHRLTTQTGN